MTPAPTKSDDGFETLLGYLNSSRGFDFTGYKRLSLMRRIDRRMQSVEVDGYLNYIDYLEVHPEEFAQLFNTILINVTAFFRDSTAWEFIAEDIIPRILAEKSAGSPIRVWSAGCSSGEEAFTVAMILASAMGIQGLRDRVKIYATDVDEEALNQARMARYTARQVAGVPPAMLDTYFERVDSQFVLSKDLRRVAIFGRHDLIQDAPISRIDLLISRNTLMYFNAEIQAKILARFHFALSETGFLFLGKAEMLFTHTNLFMPVDLKRRLFSPTNKKKPRGQFGPATPEKPEQEANRMATPERMRDLLFNYASVAQIAVDLDGALALFNDRAAKLFRLSAQDTGRPLQDLELSYRPVELRSCIDKAQAERQAVSVKDVPWGDSTGQKDYYDIQVLPLHDVNGRYLGASVSFTNVSRYKELQDDLVESKKELETAYEELQTTNEELETTNEELQSTVEELETTNEELQSTNEELETINEELQSMNEELQTMNSELRHRSMELNQVNVYMSSILGSLSGGVVVLDQELRVHIWNSKMEELWGLRSDEVRDQHFLNLDIGLPADDLRQMIRACLTGQSQFQQIVVAARNRRGKPIQCSVICTPLAGEANMVPGAILLMKDNSRG